MPETFQSLDVEAGSVELVLMPAGEKFSSPIGTVLIVPPFAMQARDLFPASFVLANNGFDVVRLDGRNALGAGSGSIEDYRLSTVCKDIESTVKFLNNSEKIKKPLLAVGLSLSTRPLMQVAPDLEIAGAVFFTPVVNLKDTLKKVIGEDFFSFPPETLPEFHTVLGHPLPGAFILDAKSSGMDDLDSAIRDSKLISAPVAFLAGDEDPWVKQIDVHKCAEASPNLRSEILVEASSHELNRSPKLALNYLMQLTKICFNLIEESDRAVAIPRFSEIITARSKVPEKKQVVHHD